MARCRSIKPEFFKHEALTELSPLHRLLFIGLWTQADWRGRLEDRPKRLKLDILPWDNCDVNTMLADLWGGGFILRYAVNGKLYIWIPSFTKHQFPNKKEKAVPSTIPAHPEDGGGLRIADCGVGIERQQNSASTIPDAPNQQLNAEETRLFIQKHRPDIDTTPMSKASDTTQGSSGDRSGTIPVSTGDRVSLPVNPLDRVTVKPLNRLAVQPLGAGTVLEPSRNQTETATAAAAQPGLKINGGTANGNGGLEARAPCAEPKTRNQKPETAVRRAPITDTDIDAWNVLAACVRSVLASEGEARRVVSAGIHWVKRPTERFQRVFLAACLQAAQNPEINDVAAYVIAMVGNALHKKQDHGLADDENLRAADKMLAESSSIRNPQSAIRNEQSREWLEAAIGRTVKRVPALGVPS